jgi:hypothetical protein
MLQHRCSSTDIAPAPLLVPTSSPEPPACRLTNGVFVNECLDGCFQLGGDGRLPRARRHCGSSRERGGGDVRSQSGSVQSHREQCTDFSPLREPYSSGKALLLPPATPDVWHSGRRGGRRRHAPCPTPCGRTAVRRRPAAAARWSWAQGCADRAAARAGRAAAVLQQRAGALCPTTALMSGRAAAG